MSRNIQRFVSISLARYAASTMRPYCLGYITPLHYRKGTVDMVLGSALATTVCRQHQSRVALPMLTIQPERHPQTQYRQEHTRYDIYDVVVTQVDGRNHEAHRNPQ